jgi:hypothetical protein
LRSDKPPPTDPNVNDKRRHSTQQKKQDKNKQPHQPAIGLFRILPVFSLSVFLLIYFLKLHVSI